MLELLELSALANMSACLSRVFSWSIKISSIPISELSGRKRRHYLCSFSATMFMICTVYFVGSTASLWRKNALVLSTLGMENCMPIGSHVLPRGIIAKTSNLDMQPLWGSVSNDVKSNDTRVLLAMAVGIKQKSLVYPVVEKFLADGFDLMLFHYDGMVNEWNDLEWSRKVIHISAANQTKLWFAKRFLHPDIVADYEYIFLWDEDLGVEHFSPRRYLTIIREEGLEISQPGLDASTSELHHGITVRRKSSRVHRRYYNFRGHKKCFANSTVPPCTGFVEIMAPVFSRAAWRCVWYMLQNDLIHGWGFDMQLGYCAQGDRTVKVGVVDEEYISHLGVPSLGGPREKKKNSTGDPGEASSSNSSSDNSTATGFDKRAAIRIRSTDEMKIFKKRWNTAVEEDNCWVDPFKQTASKNIN